MSTADQRTDDVERSGVPLEVDADLVESVSELLQERQRGMLLNLIADLYPADQAQLIARLEEEDALRLISWLEPDQVGQILAELDDPVRARLLEEMEPEHITVVLNEMDSDDAADVIADLPEELAKEILPGLEDAVDVGELLAYEEESAGGLMSTEFVAVREDWTVAEATDEVRRKAEHVEPIFAVYAVDEGGKLVGVVSLKKLLLSPSHMLIRNIMEDDFISVRPDVDQEEVARLMERYDLVSLAVVDGSERIIGRITIDDVVDVIREEAEEDIQRISGITTGSEELTDTVFRVSRGRLPWLILGLFGTILAGFVVSRFETSLEEAVVLAAFIPVMTAMAGNAAIQSAAITVQGLASGRLWDRDLFKRVGKEFVVAMLNGVLLASVLGFVVVVTQFAGPDSLRLSLVAGLALFVVIILATTNGALVPVLLQRFGIDPAIAMGPFVTTTNDIVGLTVYFLIATMLYL